MPTPSPVCSINGGAVPADVAAASTVNGALTSSAGANYWSITVVATDELNTVAGITASLAVNQGAKTFSFTAPAVGSAVILRSTVGINGLGLDANSILQASYSTTFKVNVKAANGLRVCASNEQFEQDPATGWLTVLNALIRHVA